MKINLGKKEIIHFIGIGGIGMSGLALIMKQLGFKIQGSDISVNKNIERLKKSNIKIFTKHKISNLNKANIIVISSAIKNNNIELNAAKKKDLPIYKRGDMLAHMTSLKKNIVVAGSHGKTTTTSLIASVFSKAYPNVARLSSPQSSRWVTSRKKTFSMNCNSSSALCCVYVCV